MAVKTFGGIDILVNNASAISLTNTEDTQMKRYDLMHSINTRGTFLMSKQCLPYLKQSKNAHILNISPPLLMEPRWFSNHVAYTIAKYGMSMCVLGMHEEFRSYAIWTAAMDMLSDGSGASGSRKPEIMADAAYAMLSRNSRDYTGKFAIDEEVLRAEGVTDFTKYAIDPSELASRFCFLIFNRFLFYIGRHYAVLGAPLIADFFIPNIENYPETFLQSPERQKSVDTLKKAAVEEDITNVLANMRNLVSKELVEKLSAVYEFTLTGDKERKVLLDLKNGDGSITEKDDDNADVKFTLAATDFAPMFTGKLTPTNAFMAKKLKIKGDMAKALKLEGVLKKLTKSKL
uniref:Hydroxysteroid dehydrogenase-like protein 2 n=1 Tax=Angiostrongylus cantonensis TaxID=6313 RepID=A0A0K0D072_ANGCA